MNGEVTVKRSRRMSTVLVDSDVFSFSSKVIRSGGCTTLIWTEGTVALSS